MNDNKWHWVKLTREPAQDYSIMVDGKETPFPSYGRTDILDLDGYLYLGGVPRIMYRDLPDHVSNPYQTN